MSVWMATIKKKGGDILLKNKIKQITLSLIIIFVTVAGAVSASRALFTDTELSAKTISMGTLNLQIGSEDPFVIPLDFTGMVSGDSRTYEAEIKNTGTIVGNFWFEPEISNSQEGENPESETDIEGEGEMDDCVRMTASIFDQNQEQVLIDDVALVDLQAEYDLEPHSLIDQLVNGRMAYLRLYVHTNQCGNEAIGDLVDMNLMFHLDQV
ncbi:MAG: hypothetical protein GF381_01445 [Candidatus Pacebacteria bacterium]|nr:hypothetical protein [Candidatus Paceibacterota bacterium]